MTDKTRKPTLALADLLALPAGMQLDLEIAKLRRMYVVPQTRQMSPEEEHQFLPHVSTTWADAGPLLAEMLAAGISVSLGIRGDGWLLLHAWGVDHDYAVAVPTIADAPLGIARAFAAWKMEPDSSQGGAG